jgi:prolipoprotein diacylglyceryltransferase
MLIVFWWIWRRRDHGHAIGWLFAWYLLLGGAERFLVEFLRAKDDRLLGPLTLAQGTSVLLMVVGATLLYIWRAPAGPQPLPESLRPKQVALRGAT